MSPTGPDDTSDAGTAETRAIDWNFPFEGPLHEVFPALHEAHNAWMSAIDSLQAPDRKTHELIRMVCTVIARQPGGVQRHARLAAEVGATWDEISGSILLTQPAFGIVLAIQALPAARRGYKEGAAEAIQDDDHEVKSPGS